MADNVDPFEAAKARGKAKAEEDTAKTEGNSGFMKGVEAFGGKTLSTLTGGLSDYLELARRNIGADPKDKVTIDQVRDDANKLYRDRSGLAFGGELAGNAAQFMGVGKGINLAARGIQAIPALAGAGKAIGTAMNAPGIAGGLQSGGMTGIGTGLLKEGVHQADRLGSDKTAKEEFNPISSASRIGLEGGMGLVGGGLGGVIGNLSGKGQLAKLTKEAIPEGDIAAIKAATDPAKGMGMGPTAAEGKLAGHEALRFAGNPKYTGLASDLEGLTQYASKNATGGRLADEAAGSAARNAPTADSFSGLRKEAGTRLASADTAVSNMGKDQLTPAAYWSIEGGNPALKQLRDQVLAEARTLSQANLQSGGMGKTAARAQAVTDNPAQVVEAITRMMPRAKGADQQGIRDALELQSPFFKTLHETQGTARDFTRLQQSLGRQHANAPPDPSPSFGASLFGGPATWAKDALILGKRAAEGGAMKQAGKMNLDLEIEDLLRMIGRRTAGQKVTQGAVSPLLQTFGGHAFD